MRNVFNGSHESTHQTKRSPFDQNIYWIIGFILEWPPQVGCQLYSHDFTSFDQIRIRILSSLDFIIFGFSSFSLERSTPYVICISISSWVNYSLLNIYNIFLDIKIFYPSIKYIFTKKQHIIF
jgi:hypothetical protein